MKDAMKFGEWCRKNARVDLIDRWDVEANQGKTADDISYKSNKKYYFKCPRNLHESELSDIQYIPSGRTKEIKCKKCNSFAQFIIDIFGEEYFNAIWDFNANEKEGIDPWLIPKKSSKKGHFICENISRHKYPMSFNHFSTGHRCKYCSGQDVEEGYSLADLEPRVIPLWSVKNEKGPDKYSLHSGLPVFWRCENNIHDDYRRKISRAYYQRYRCAECEKLEHGKNKRDDLTGRRFGLLEAKSVNEKITKKLKRVYWNCICECGEKKIAPAYRFKDGSVTTCGNRTLHFSAENNGNWKGGITPQVQVEKNSAQYKQWALSVYRKDYFTCQCCGKYGDTIEKQAHHILSYAYHEDQRYDISNGITLCKECHYTTINGSFHNMFGTYDATPDELEYYINEKRELLGIDKIFSIEKYQEGERLLPKEISY